MGGIGGVQSSQHSHFKMFTDDTSDQKAASHVELGQTSKGAHELDATVSDPRAPRDVHGDQLAGPRRGDVMLERQEIVVATNWLKLECSGLALLEGVPVPCSLGLRAPAILHEGAEPPSAVDMEYHFLRVQEGTDDPDNFKDERVRGSQ